MKNSFIKYLEKEGYRILTPSGLPSTGPNYANRVDRVRKQEGLTWPTLANDIDRIVSIYDTGGTKEDKGKQSHSVVINALKRFQEFCHTTTTP